jgi:Protein of unknown function (DUF1569)
VSTAVDTSKVEGRRELSFNSIDEVGADVERLARAREVRVLGNWSSGQVLQHLTIVRNNSIDGAPPMVPWIVTQMLRIFVKKRVLAEPMSAGFQLPKGAKSLIPEPIAWDIAVQNFRKALNRLQTETERKPHPAFGPLTHEEWNRLHCRHSALHLSFLIPVD